GVPHQREDEAERLVLLALPIAEDDEGAVVAGLRVARKAGEQERRDADLARLVPRGPKNWQQAHRRSVAAALAVALVEKKRPHAIGDETRLAVVLKQEERDDGVPRLCVVILDV